MPNIVRSRRSHSAPPILEGSWKNLKHFVTSDRCVLSPSRSQTRYNRKGSSHSGAQTVKSTSAQYAVTQSESGNRNGSSHTAPRVVETATARYAVIKSDPEANGRCLKARKFQPESSKLAQDKATSQVMKSPSVKYVATMTDSQSGRRCLKALKIRCKSPQRENDKISFVEGGEELLGREADALPNLPCRVGRFTISSAMPETPRDELH